MNQYAPYSPCPCGSGKKYKFCCYNRQYELMAVLVAKKMGRGSFVADEGYFEGEPDEAQKGCRDGLAMMRAGEYAEAAILFEKAVEVAPRMTVAFNNLAVCRFAQGSLEEAVLAQKKSLESASRENPFGLANMAILQYVMGSEACANRCIEEACALQVDSQSSLTKICEALARFKRHQDIMEMVDRSQLVPAPMTLFFSGVAAANSGDLKRAKRELMLIPSDSPKSVVAQEYLEYINDGRRPQTLGDDWPYFFIDEVCSAALLDKLIYSSNEAWLGSHFLVDIAEALINQDEENAEIHLQILTKAEHPKVKWLLRALISGAMGSYNARTVGMTMLRDHGAIGSDEPFDMFLDDEWVETGDYLIQADSSIKFLQPLPLELQGRFDKANEKMQGNDPDWQALYEEYDAILQEAPDAYPILMSRTECLLRLERYAEAEPVIRQLIAEHPQYLFAHAALLRLLFLSDRDAEAEEFVRTAEVPAVSHPEAIIEWYYACYQFNIRRKELDGARHFESLIEDINPRHHLLSVIEEEIAEVFGFVFNKFDNSFGDSSGKAQRVVEDSRRKEQKRAEEKRKRRAAEKSKKRAKKKKRK